MFPNFYVYGASALALIIFFVIIIIKKPKKEKKQEKKQKTLKKPELVKTRYMTDFDRFYNYIIEKDKVTITKMSKVFKMPKPQVEEWARILEERKLIKINYPLFGEPVLKCPS